MPANGRWDLIRRRRVNIQGRSVHTVKKNTEDLFVASKEI